MILIVIPDKKVPFKITLTMFMLPRGRHEQT